MAGQKGTVPGGGERAVRHWPVQNRVGYRRRKAATPRLQGAGCSKGCSWDHYRRKPNCFQPPAMGMKKQGWSSPACRPVLPGAVDISNSPKPLGRVQAWGGQGEPGPRCATAESTAMRLWCRVSSH